MSIVSRLRGYVNSGRVATPERAIEDAYGAALAIRAIEEEHFQGQPISSQYGQYSTNTMAYFQGELRKYLKIARANATRFRSNLSNLDRETLNKLQFIDQVLDRYSPGKSTAAFMDASRAMVSVPIQPVNGQMNSLNELLQERTRLASDSAKPKGGSTLEGLTDKTGLLPRSILGTLNRLKRDLDPESDEVLLENLRANRAKTFIAIRFLLMLVTLTLFVQISTRHVILSNQWLPGQNISKYYQVQEKGTLFINAELEEEALKELTHFEEKLKFKNMLNEALEKDVLSPEQMEGVVRREAKHLADSFATKSADAVKNWVADLMGLIMFCFILANSQREIEILKSFIDELVYGLSDSAKAFIIILFTDVFVGFHSSHGWEVLLEGIAKHFGIAPSRDFIFVFIATFPVILDTIFKYWIFRYLNRVSPSAVATYHNMNEG
ncbi:MAG: proton extrusion protein PcxA [Alkalinema sp. RU_4_3]|nr:proton extrusion protein PcxA [Alkalinema sp. RU_4_3]